jgi:hypothetical protein
MVRVLASRAQAAGIRGDTLEVKGQLLRELLTESNAFGYLMGSGGPGAEAGQPLSWIYNNIAQCSLQHLRTVCTSRLLSRTLATRAARRYPIKSLTASVRRGKFRMTV